MSPLVIIGGLAVLGVGYYLYTKQSSSSATALPADQAAASQAALNAMATPGGVSF